MDRGVMMSAGEAGVWVAAIRRWGRASQCFDTRHTCNRLTILACPAPPPSLHKHRLCAASTPLHQPKGAQHAGQP